MSWVLIPSTNKRGESGPQISCGKTYKLSGQQIPWGRVILGGYNFASFKGMLLKLIQATILDFEINISDKKSRRFDLSEVIFKCIKVL